MEIRGRDPTLTVSRASEILAALRARDGAKDLLVGMAAHQERLRRDSEELEEKGRALIAKLKPLAAN